MPATQIYTAIYVLTDAQTKALPTTGIDIVPAPGSGKFILPVYGIFHATWVADYANIDAAAELLLRVGASPLLMPLRESLSSAVSGLLAGGGPDGVLAWLPGDFKATVAAAPGSVTRSGQSGYYDSDIVDLPLVLTAANGGAGNFTGGNAGNSLKVTVLYTIIDV